MIPRISEPMMIMASPNISAITIICPIRIAFSQIDDGKMMIVQIRRLPALVLGIGTGTGLPLGH